MKPETLKKLKSAFAAVMIYSEGLTPPRKVALALVLFIQPINIPTPIDFIFYSYLLASGLRGCWKDLKGTFNGDKKRARREFVLEAWKNFDEIPEDRRIILTAQEATP